MNSKASIITDTLYTIFPDLYYFQLNFFNGNHFEVLKRKLKPIATDSILELGCGTAPVLRDFHPKTYVGLDFDPRFVKVAQKLYHNPHYTFMEGDATDFYVKGSFDIILVSHMTHHLTDEQIKKFIKATKKIKYKYLVIYDGKPIGPLAPLLTKLDLGAKFRELEEFYPLFKKDFKLIHSEVFRSNRPFYKYPLMVYKPL